MVTETTWVYPKPTDWEEFEKIVWDLFRRAWLDPDAQRYGRSGQEQHGIDVYGRPKDMGGEYVGVQCKRYEDEKFTEKVIKDEIEKVETGVKEGLLPFKPAKFIIATTASTDTKLQNVMIQINEERGETGFPILLRFWEDLSDMLASPGYEDLRGKHYPTLTQRDEIKEMHIALREAVRNLSEKQARLLVSSLKPPEQPYRHLDYFDLEQRSVFFGREMAKQDLLEVIEQGRLTLMHAPSGAGKTSLLRAGVQAALIEKQHLPVYIPRPSRLLQAIRLHILPNPPNPEWFSQIPLSAFLSWTCQDLGDPNTWLVIMIDQFEEFFIQATPLEQQDFVRSLAECLDHPGLEQVRFVLAMREEYLAKMELFALSIQRVFENRYALPNLTRDEARLAIEEPLAGRPIHWATGEVDELLDYLEKGEIETLQLQLICSRLYDKTLESGLSDVHVSGEDLKAIYALYLQEEMAALAPPEFSPSQKDLAWKLLKHLVTSSGTKQTRSLEEMYELAPPAEVDPLLKRLVDRRLLRRDVEFLSGQVTIEVAHDSLANNILAKELPDEIRRKVARELIVRGLEDWQSHSSLPLLDLSRWKILDEYRSDLAIPLLGKTFNPTRSTQAAEFLLRSAVQHGHSVLYWYEIAVQSGVAAEEILVESLKADDFRTRAAAITTLADVGERFIPDLSRMLADEYPQVRMAAIAALETLQTSGEWRIHLKYERYVPAGEFIMGLDKRGRENERPTNWFWRLFQLDITEEDQSKPTHPVSLEAFYIARYPVTNAEYARYRQDIGQPFDFPPGEDLHPVVYVSWYDARDYAAWAGMRLLTDAEWEKAASWEPDTVKKRIYPWGDEFDSTICNTEESSIGKSTPVGQFSPQGDSSYGVADMAGNVFEWCSSKYTRYPYNKDDGREELNGSYSRVRRGGSFLNKASFARCAYRYRHFPNYRFTNSGFRVGAGIPSTLDFGDSGL